MPPGPSSAPPASPADISPFPTAGKVEAAEEDGEPACRRQERGVVSPGKKSVKSKAPNMLARSSPAALRLNIQAREPQQLNGVASPSEDQRAGSRPDDPRPSPDSCDSDGGACSDDASAAERSGQRFQREGRGPFPENGGRSPLVSSSVNGVPALTRTEDGFDHPEAPRPPGVKAQEAAGPGGARPDKEPQPPPLAAEMARLDLGSSSSQMEADRHGICYVRYESELQMPWIMRLITKDLSEPYSIYTYRYFIHNWPQLCFLVSVTAKTRDCQYLHAGARLVLE